MNFSVHPCRWRYIDMILLYNILMHNFTQKTFIYYSSHYEARFCMLTDFNHSFQVNLLKSFPMISLFRLVNTAVIITVVQCFIGLLLNYTKLTRGLQSGELGDMMFGVMWRCPWCIGGAYGVMVIVVGNGHGNTSSNPRRDWLHFTLH